MVITQFDWQTVGQGCLFQSARVIYFRKRKNLMGYLFAVWSLAFENQVRCEPSCMAQVLLFGQGFSFQPAHLSGKTRLTPRAGDFASLRFAKRLTLAVGRQSQSK